MTKTLVIGYGNTLRGDDAVGRLVAEAVAAWNLPDVQALSVHQLSPELAADLSEAEQVVFVDAGRQFGLTPVAPSRTAAPTTHFASPDGLLALTEAVYGRLPSAFLLTIPAAGFEIGAALSPATRTGMADALERLRELLSAEV